jgi:hypothetical protein
LRPKSPDKRKGEWLYDVHCPGEHQRTRRTKSKEALVVVEGDCLVDSFVLLLIPASCTDKVQLLVEV